MIIAGLGIYFLLVELAKLASDDEGASGMAMSGILVLIGFASKIYWDVRYSVETYQATVMQTLYNKSNDNHSGVILFLLDALATQEWKEAAIAFALLARHKRLVETELDGLAEAFVTRLLKKFEPGDAQTPAVNFEVDDAVQKLVRF